MAEAVTGVRTPSRFPAVHYGGHLLAVAAAVAFLITTIRFFTPLSGINGTYGALMAMFGEAALVLAGVCLALLPRGGVRTTFAVLAWIGIVLTLFATVLLHGVWSTVALAIGLLGLLAESFSRGRPQTVRR